VNGGPGSQEILLPARAGIDSADEELMLIGVGKLASVPDALVRSAVTAVRQDQDASCHGIAARPFDCSTACRNARGPAILFNTGFAVFVRFSTI